MNFFRSCCQNPAPQGSVDMQRISCCAPPTTASALRQAHCTQNHLIWSASTPNRIKNVTKYYLRGFAGYYSVSCQTEESSQAALTLGRVFVTLGTGTDALFRPLSYQASNSTPQPLPSFLSKSLNRSVHPSPDGVVDLCID